MNIELWTTVPQFASGRASHAGHIQEELWRCTSRAWDCQELQTEPQHFLKLSQRSRTAVERHQARQDVTGPRRALDSIPAQIMELHVVATGQPGHEGQPPQRSHRTARTTLVAPTHDGEADSDRMSGRRQTLGLKKEAENARRRRPPSDGLLRLRQGGWGCVGGALWVAAAAPPESPLATREVRASPAGRPKRPPGKLKPIGKFQMHMF
jgi:hypothetical protein